MGIKQIAKLANVSIGTVDRVIHKRSGVSSETEKKVLKIIKEVGYVKNTTASRLKLASKKKINFAILIPEAYNVWNYWRLPRKGITKAVTELSELGVKADFHDFIDRSSFSERGNELINGDYDAIVTVAFFEKESNALLLSAKSEGIPVVFLDTEITLNSPAYFIRQDSYKAGKVAARLLHGLVGDQGQYFVLNMLNDRGVYVNILQREKGFRLFFEAEKSKVDIHSITYSFSGEFKVTKEMEAWFKEEKPKGIFVTNSNAHLVSRILENYAVKNAFVVGFDLNEKNLACLKEDKLNFIINQQPVYQGYAAIKGLFNFLTKKDDSELTIDIPVEIMVKENVPL